MMRIAPMAFAAICLVTASPAYAEVADKEPSIAWLWGEAIIINLLAIVLERVRPKLGLVVLPIAAFLAWGGYMELTDPYVGPAIRQELGQGYITTSYLTYAVALLGPVIIVFLHAKMRRSRN